MITLSKTDILSANDIKTELYEVPEWGGAVYLREMNVKERSRLYEMLKNGKIENAQALTMAVSDSEGKPLFTETDTGLLCQKSGAVVDKVLRQWLKLNGLANDAIEDAEKN